MTIQYTNHCAQLRVLGEDIQLLLSYATLSHCWGSARIFRCTLDNIDQTRANIDVEHLPRTFHDALCVISKAFGIEYIWRDSPPDWKSEAKTVAKVYEKAIVNVAASVSLDSHGGLFHDRASDRMTTGYFRPKPIMKEYLAVESISNTVHFWTNALGDATLNSRG